MNVWRAINRQALLWVPPLKWQQATSCLEDRCLVNEGSQSDVSLREAPTVVCAECDLDLGERRRWSEDKDERLQERHGKWKPE